MGYRRKNMFFVRPVLRRLSGLAFCLLCLPAFSQDIQEARAIIDTLCAPSMGGRGYVNSGDKKAAAYIASFFKKCGLQSFEQDYYQKFGIAVNTFPGEMQVHIDGQPLKAGADFLVNISSGSLKGTFPVHYLSKSTFVNKSKFKAFLSSGHQGHVIAIHLDDFNEQEKLELNREVFLYPDLAKGVLLISKSKLTWGSLEFYTSLPIIFVRQEAMKADAREVYIHLESVLVDRYVTQNVIGYFPGKTKPDSFLVFAAHYDHLGHMGAATYFPGANDNAAGVSMLLQLACFFGSNKPDYSIAFIAFGAEETGLQGSKYYVSNPLFRLEKIKLLINLDLVGTGDDGLMVVNAKQQQKAYHTLAGMNNDKKFVQEIRSRDNAPNSDHFPFTQKHVPAIFIYGLGGIQAYHDIYDIPRTLPLTAYKNIFRLLVAFAGKY